MTTNVVDIPSPAVRSGRATAVLLSLAAFIAVVFVAGAA